jgi:hypothetical protein
MKAEASAHATSVNQALAKGACPICGMLKDFQCAGRQRPTASRSAIVQFSRLGARSFQGRLARALYSRGECYERIPGDAKRSSPESEQR